MNPYGQPYGYPQQMPVQQVPVQQIPMQQPIIPQVQPMYQQQPIYQQPQVQPVYQQPYVVPQQMPMQPVMTQPNMGYVQPTMGYVQPKFVQPTVGYVPAMGGMMTNPNCHKCFGKGYKMKNGKPCKRCMGQSGICYKCRNTGITRKGKHCKECHFKKW